MKGREGVLVITGMNKGNNTYEWTNKWILGFACFFQSAFGRPEHMCTISDMHMEDVG